MGISTVEQLAALGATDDGVRAISEELHVELADAQELLDAARADLPAATRDELDRPAETTDFGVELPVAFSYKSALTITHTQHRRRSYVDWPSEHTFR